ncbi:MAG: hypothetical protein U1E76_08660 [Planctomycetota bacterium]
MEKESSYDSAIRYFETVLNHIQWSSINVDWGDLKDRATRSIEQAKRSRDEAHEKQMKAVEEETLTRLRDEEERERARQQARIDNLTVAAVDEFQARRFDKAEDLANEILKLDPKNDRAKDLLESSEQAARKQRGADYIRDRTESYLKWKEDIERTRVPQHDILQGPDAAFWEEISRIRGSQRRLGLEQLEDPETQSLRLSLKSQRMPANFEEASIDDVANTITTLTGIPVNIDPEVRKEVTDAGQTVTLKNLNSVTVEALLNIITRQLGEGLTHTVRHGTVMITKKEKAYGAPIIKTHPVQDITFGLQDFKGPKIDRITLPGAQEQEEGPGVFGGDLEKVVIISPEDVVNLIKENIARETWDQEQYKCEVATNNQLLVIHTPEVQTQIAEFLDDLRRFSSQVVTIESRFVAVTDAFIQEIGSDFRGLGGEFGSNVTLDDLTNGLEDKTSQGLDNEGSGLTGASPSSGVFFNDNSDGDIRGRSENFWANPLGSILSTVGGGSFQFGFLDDTQVNLVLRMIEKSVNATEISAPILTVFNTERAYFTNINEVSYLQDFDVDVANTAFIANPQVGVIQEGIVLDVRPTISYDRRFITLEIQTTVANLKRPIPEFETSLGGFSVPIRFQLPEIDVSSSYTTVQVPDGGSIIMGGMKKIRYVNRTAAIPWFSKIPIVGFFFQSKGIDDEVQNLIVLVRAHITDLNPLRESRAAK